MNYKLTSIILVTVAVIFMISCSDNTTHKETENLEAATAMTESLNKMVASNTALGIHHEGQLYHHHYSIYHHNDSIYIHHHQNYHHGDTIHHHSDGHHNENHHHQHDSITASHHTIAH